MLVRFTSLRGVALIVLASLAGAVLVAAVARAGQTTVRQVARPSVVHWIAYVRGGNVRLVRPDGTGDHTLDGTLGMDQQRPDWSPDGKRIALDVTNTSIWVIDANGKNRRQVISCGGLCQFVQHAAWSPDGKTIAFARGDLTASGDETARSRILTLDLASGVVRTVVTVTGGIDLALQPRWSPDGRRLVFELTRYVDAKTSTIAITGSRIGIVRSDGKGTVRYLTKFEDLAAAPDWSWRRNVIVYQAGTRGIPESPSDRANLYTVNPDGTDRRQLTRFKPPAERAVQPSWTPDGSRIIFTYVRGGGFGQPVAAFIGKNGGGLVAPPSGTPIQTHPRLQP